VVSGIDCHFVNLVPLELGEEVVQVHLGCFLGSDVLSSSEQLLETRIVADQVPDWIDF